MSAIYIKSPSPAHELRQIMSKIPKAALSLKQFILRQEVLKLYRTIFRTISQVPDAATRQELREWARYDFRQNKHQTDEVMIKMLMHNATRSLKELQTSLELSGTPSAPNTTERNR